MAAHYSANQYQSAFNSSRLQNWNVPKPYKERPSTHDGFTQIIANDRGHLLPGVPRAKVSPWGTFLGTWDMPLRIPPAKLSLTSRSADASKRLTHWIQTSDPLISACNGLRPTITGKVPIQKEGSPRPSPPPSQKSVRDVRSPEKMEEAAAQRSTTITPTGSHKSDPGSRKTPEEERKEENVEEAHRGSKPPSQCGTQRGD
ncbi:protein Flattop [Mantella aurantiaca]